MIDLALIKSVGPHLLTGVIVTLQIAFYGSLLGFFGGTLLGVAHTSSSKLPRYCVTLFVTLIRGTPMLLQIMFFFLMLPSLGISISPLLTAIVAIGLNSSAYISQIVRSGIISVSQGQIEAATTLGISRYDITRHIVLPQALRVVMPALGNEFITLIKDSSLASTIGVLELYKRGEISVSQSYNALGIYTLVGLCYLILTSLVSLLFLKIEHSYQKKYARN
jgi:arginine/lysine/histidine/glutamine transport system substrate-binding/permease protein